MTIAAAAFDYDRVAQTYDRAHDRWLRHAGGEAQCAFEGALTALLSPGMSLLDVACGSGTVARRLRRVGPGALDLHLLDASPAMIGLCDNIRATARVGRMEAMPYPDARFDMLACAWGLEILPHPIVALREFARVLRPSGRACLVFCADRPAPSLLGRVLRQHIAHTARGRFLDPHAVTRMAQRAGFARVLPLHCTGPAAALVLQKA